MFINPSKQLRKDWELGEAGHLLYSTDNSLYLIFWNSGKALLHMIYSKGDFISITRKLSKVPEVKDFAN